MKKIPNQNISSIIKRYQLSDSAKELLAPGLSPVDAIEALKQAKLYSDAVQFIAHALPMVEAIYWATECLALSSDEWDDQRLQTLNTVRQWLKQPNETLRIRANQLAERLGLETAPAWTAKAIYWSGTGSIVDADLPQVLPPAFLYGQAVSSAIVIAAAVPAWSHDDGYESYFQSSIQLGLAIANGQPLVINELQHKEVE